MLGPSRHIGPDAGIGQRPAQLGLGRFDVVLAVAAAFVEQTRDAPIGVGLQQAEGLVLQLPLQLPDTQAVGQGRVDVGREARQLLAFGRRHRRRSAQTRHLPRQQHEHHTKIAHHGQQQAAQALGAAADGTLAVQRPDLFRRLQPVQQGGCGGARAGDRRDATQA